MSQFVLSDPQLPPRQSLAPRLGAVDVQSLSPFFTAIPAEIRNRIFSIALTAYDDKSKPYRPQNWFYRPDWHFHRIICTTLLRTCKRIYLECHLLPLALNSHTFWAGPDRAPPSHYFVGAYRKPLPSGRGCLLGNWNACENFRGFFNKLTVEQRGAVGELHFFFQQYYLESLNFSPPLDPDAGRPVAARKLKVTMRHQDWYWWERNEKLGLCPWNRGRTTWDKMDTPMPQTRTGWLASQGWGAQLQYIQGLEAFELELETLVEKKGELGAIVERATRWVFPLQEDRVLRWDRGTGVREDGWEEADVALHGDVLSPEEPWPGGAFPLPLATTARGAVLDRSTPGSRHAPPRPLRASGVTAQPPSPAPATRQYYIVSLTWTVRAREDDEWPPPSPRDTPWRPMVR